MCAVPLAFTRRFDQVAYTMKIRMRCLERLAVFVWLVVAAVAASGIGSLATASRAEAQITVTVIVVEGNQRVDADTIRAYARIRPGERVDGGRIDEAYKALIGTGLFADVRIDLAGTRLVIAVVENPVINRVAFEGNKKVKDETLLAEIQSKARSPLQRTVVQADVQRIIEVYRRSGRYDVRVEPKIIERSNNRVDLVFEIKEGDKTAIKKIVFIGNKAFSDFRLRDVLTTGESNLLSFFSNKDVYDPDRVNADQELLRRFYLKNGYADFRILSATVELDRSGGGGLFGGSGSGFVLTLTLDEGEQYRFGDIDVLSNLRNVDPAVLKAKIKGGKGSVYNAELVEKSLEEVTIELARAGYAFAQVKPRGDRDFAAHTINVTYIVEEGPRVYVERIAIRGNTRTRDWVIRREFDIYEGDPYNRVLIDRAERRLKNLGFFKTVKITNETGSAPDRVVVLVDVEEQLTGEFSIAGGYSTMDGIIAEISVGEKNFLGRGQYARVAGTLGQRARGIEFSFTEPYFMDYRVAAGFDVFYKAQLLSAYQSFDTTTIGGTLRAGFQLTDELSFGVRYSAYQRTLSIPGQFSDCTVYPYTDLDPVTPGCASNGEASLAIKQSIGTTTTSLVGYTIAYNALDNVQNPTLGFYTALNQDLAGAGGDVRYIRTSGEARTYYPLYGDFVFMAKAQGGYITSWGGDQLRMLDHFFLGPTLVRGFAPAGIGPRDITPGSLTQDALGGSMYWGTTAEIQFPLFFLPKDLGIKAAVFADAGSEWGYKGATTFPIGNTGFVCPDGTVVPASLTTAQICVGDSSKIRTSAGVSVIWASPFGPLRFDFGFALSKEPYDRTQVFRFGGGSRF
jgi:outer membrane protein insertion porin family